uniref:Uncharacterized protein n=1 Tax=Avena sativa TaxID=4498 RepID=A0ACD5YT82_AVESA
MMKFAGYTHLMLSAQQKVHISVSCRLPGTPPGDQFLARRRKSGGRYGKINLAPRVKTFAWRLIRRALATGARASKFSKHIAKECSRCGMLETDSHLLFHCPFAKAVWFSSSVGLKTDAFDTKLYPSNIIQSILQNSQSKMSIDKIFTTLWCIWKARNDYRFNGKNWSVLQVHHAANALLSCSIEDQTTACSVAFFHAGPKAYVQAKPISRQETTPSPGTTVKDTSNIPGPIIFTDAAWLPGRDGQLVSAGLGIFIQFGEDRPCSQVYVSAVSPLVSSAIQAEAFGLLFATKAAEVLQIKRATFLTDNAVLAKVVASQDLLNDPGHWTIRPQLAEIAATSSFDATRTFHISRSLNFKAHHQAKLALKLQGRSLYSRCLNSASGVCLNSDVTSVCTEPECRVLFVKCC